MDQRKKRSLKRSIGPRQSSIGRSCLGSMFRSQPRRLNGVASRSMHSLGKSTSRTDCNPFRKPTDRHGFEEFTSILSAFLRLGKRSTRSLTIQPRMPSNGLSIDCWRHLLMDNGGAVIGLTWLVTRTQTERMKITVIQSLGVTVTTSSKRLTEMCPTIALLESNLLATYFLHPTFPAKKSNAD